MKSTCYPTQADSEIQQLYEGTIDAAAPGDHQVREKHQDAVYCSPYPATINFSRASTSQAIQQSRTNY